MTLFIYVVLLAYGLISIIMIGKRFSKFSLFFIFITAFYVLIIIPSYYVYYTNYFNYDLLNYFVSLLIILVTMSIASFFIKPRKVNFISNEISPNVGSLNDSTKLNFISKIFVYITISIAILYIALAIKSSGFGTLPILYSFQNSGAELVSFRKDFWRGSLNDIPLGSLIRFLSKYGMLVITCLYIVKKKKIKAAVLLLLTFICFTLEGTKSSAIELFIPIILFIFISGKLNKKRVTLIAIIVTVISALTLGFAYSESNNLYNAFTENIINRIFYVPNIVAMKHYIVTGNNFLYGATIEIIANIRGGYSDILPLHSLDYDNYIYKLIFYESNGYYTEYGGANAPFFVNGWNDFGYVGVLLITILLIIGLQLVEKIFLFDQNNILYYGVLVYWIYSLTTSFDVISWLFGIEKITGLILIKILLFGINKDLRFKRVEFTLVNMGIIYYVISSLSHMLV